MVIIWQKKSKKLHILPQPCERVSNPESLTAVFAVKGGKTSQWKTLNKALPHSGHCRFWAIILESGFQGLNIKNEKAESNFSAACDYSPAAAAVMWLVESSTQWKWLQHGCIFFSEDKLSTWWGWSAHLLVNQMFVSENVWPAVCRGLYGFS